MSTPSIVEVRAHVNTDYVEVPDSEGHILLAPRLLAEHYRRQGIGSAQHTLLWEKVHFFDQKWLTLAEAAQEHLEDLPVPSDEQDEKRLIHLAKIKISNACSEGEIVSRGSGRTRGIDQTSLRIWRLAERVKADRRESRR